MEFDWSKPYSETVKGAAKDIHIGSDKLDRARYAKFLTEYLQTYDKAPYVINLNAEWGAGKTYFLQRWYHNIKAVHPAVYIDAWQHDFSDDPLLTVISAITESLEFTSEQKYLIVNSLKSFVKHTTPAIIGALIKNYTGLDTDKFKLENFADAAEEAMKFALQDHKQKINELEQFKSTIDKILKDKTDKKALKKPMFVFIDELDRCRPTYAIELLETVKHLFDIPGLVFVIATNTEQLQHSIKAVYGAGFDAQKYLYRFFNRSYTLKQPNQLAFIKAQPIFTERLSVYLEKTCDGNILTSDEQLAESLASIAESFSFDLRTTLQWMEQLTACYRDTEVQRKYFWVVVAVLTAVKLYKPALFADLFLLVEPVNILASGKEELELKHAGILNEQKQRGLNQIRFTCKNDVERIALGKRYAETPNQYDVRTSGIDNQQLYKLSFLLKRLEIKAGTNQQDIYSKVRIESPDIYTSLEIPLVFSAKAFTRTRFNYVDLVEMAADLT